MSYFRFQIGPRRFRLCKIGLLAAFFYCLAAPSLAGSNPPRCSLQGAHHRLLLQRTLENLAAGARVRLFLDADTQVEGYYYPGFLPNTIMVARFPRIEGRANTVMERIIPLDSIASIESLPLQTSEPVGRAESPPLSST